MKKRRGEKITIMLLRRMIIEKKETTRETKYPTYVEDGGKNLKQIPCLCAIRIISPKV